MTTIDESLLPEELPPERRGWRTADLARAATVALAVWFGLQLLWSVSSLVFLVFLATLFGLAVGRGADYLERFKIRRGIGAALIMFGALGAIIGILTWTAPTLIEQGKELQRQVPDALHKVQTWVDSKRGGLVGTLITSAAGTDAKGPDSAVATAAGAAGPAARPGAPTAAGRGAPSSDSAAVPAAGGAKGTAAGASVAPVDSTVTPSEALRQKLQTAMSGATKYLFSFVSNTLAVLTSLVLLIFLAIYIGAEPEVYRGWLLAAVPAASRAQVRVVMGEMATVLRKWLVTQLIAMVVIGVMSMIALLLLGVKAAFALGFIAGLLEFIPTVGPVLSAVPAILMGFVDSPEKALVVGLVYWGIQFVENNLLIPYLMRGEMDLPPAITLVAQTLMTLVFGFIGLMVAVPLTAALLVPLRMIAERENAREKTLVKQQKLQTMAPPPDGPPPP
jgi:predicted PurR-regulated permease PerM